MARYAREELRLGKVAILTEARNVYSEGLAREFARRFKELGGELVATDSYAKGETDFRSQLAAIRDLKPKGIYVPGYVAEAVAIAQQARQLGVDATLLGGDGWDSEKLFETGGAWIEGAYITNHYSADDPAAQDFALAYKGAYGSVPDARAALGYDAARMAMDAMGRAPEPSGPALRDALAQTRDFVGVTGTLSIDERRNAVKPAVVLRVEAGRFRFVKRVAP